RTGEMMSPTEPLLPCPFCGGCDTEIRRGTKDREGTPTSRVCAGCGAAGPWEYEEDDEHTLADAAWNCRTPPAAAPEGWEPTPDMVEAARSVVRQILVDAAYEFRADRRKSSAMFAAEVLVSNAMANAIKAA